MNKNSTNEINTGCEHTPMTNSCKGMTTEVAMECDGCFMVTAPLGSKPCHNKANSWIKQSCDYNSITGYCCLIFRFQ